MSRRRVLAAAYRCMRPNGLGKTSFRSRAKARQAILAQRSRGGTDKPLYAYRCPVCSLWHITSEKPRNGGHAA